MSRAPASPGNVGPAQSRTPLAAGFAVNASRFGIRSAVGVRSALAIASLFLVACGKEGPPLPPLIRLPSPPTGLVAERRGESVEIRLVVPSANTDGTRPATIERVDVYAITGASTLSDEQWLKVGTRVGSFAVKTPRDADSSFIPDAATVEKPDLGIDQGATASLTERLTETATSPVEFSSSGSPAANEPAVVPLAGPPRVPMARAYASVGVSPRGRLGPFSVRAAVPVVPPPPAVSSLEIRYSESVITVSWRGVLARSAIQEPPEGDVLPATLLAWPVTSTSYSVYEVGDRSEVRLTSPAILETQFEDKRIDWGVERCYRVHAVTAYDQLTIESEASPEGCVTPKDTFPPKPPTSVDVVPLDGKIGLTWQRGEEPDLAGFLVLRGSPSDEALKPITPDSIDAVSFVDTVAAGVTYVYAVQAVDKAGNRSAPSARSEAVEAR